MNRLPLVRLSDLDSLAIEARPVRPKPRLRDKNPLPGLARWLKPWIAAGLFVNLLLGMFGVSVHAGQSPETVRFRAWLEANAPPVARTEPVSFWTLLVASSIALLVPQRGRTGRTLAKGLVAVPGIVVLLGAAVLLVVLVLRAIPQLVGMVVELVRDLSGL